MKKTSFWHGNARNVGNGMIFSAPKSLRLCSAPLCRHNNIMMIRMMMKKHKTKGRGGQV